MSLLRSERVAAFLLVIAAFVGLVVANSAFGDAAVAVRDFHLAIPFLGLDLSVSHWVKDGLLAIFFFVAAIELRHELTHGELDSRRKALIPMVAAVGGVLVPSLIFLLIVTDPVYAVGWPIPTATDIAFALGVLALVGRGLPSRVRAMLLALAVIDDLIAILIIAFFFTTDLQPLALIGAVPLVLLFGWLSFRGRSKRAPLVITAMIVIGIVTWVLVYHSGIHPTVAGVALGLVMTPGSAEPTRRGLEPWTNALVLPLFALVASIVLIPDVGVDELNPVFWGILVALPVGKLIGITAGAMIARQLAPKRERAAALSIGDVLVVASLGGIGFTVSLLMNELAFEAVPEVAAEGTLAVLGGSLFSIIIGVIITVVRVRQHRASHTLEPEEAKENPVA